MERQNRLFFRHSSKMERLLTIPQTSEDHSQLDHEINLSWRSNLKTSHCISVLKSRLYIVHRYINKNNKTHKPSHTHAQSENNHQTIENTSHTSPKQEPREENNYNYYSIWEFNSPSTWKPTGKKQPAYIGLSKPWNHAINSRGILTWHNVPTNRSINTHTGNNLIKSCTTMMINTLKL